MTDSGKSSAKIILLFDSSKQNSYFYLKVKPEKILLFLHLNG